jgi:hypothetical protein
MVERLHFYVARFICSTGTCPPFAWPAAPACLVPCAAGMLLLLLAETLLTC